MSLKKISEAAVRVIRDLPTRPTGPTGRYTGVQLQAFFDKAAQNIRDTFNELVTKLESSGGAAEIGFSETDTVHGANVQAAIENVQEQVRSAYEESAIPDGAVTGDKILAGSLLVDVTNNVSWTLAEGEYSSFASKELKFYFCRALGIVFVDGVISNIVVEQARDLYDNASITFVWSGYLPKRISERPDGLIAIADNMGVPYHAMIRRIGNLVTISVRDRGLSDDYEDGNASFVDVHVSGWYFCDGA